MALGVANQRTHTVLISCLEKTRDQGDALALGVAIAVERLGRVMVVDWDQPAVVSAR
jgi:hypothetical protein